MKFLAKKNTVTHGFYSSLCGRGLRAQRSAALVVLATGFFACWAFIVPAGRAMLGKWGFVDAERFDIGGPLLDHHHTYSPSMTDWERERRRTSKKTRTKKEQEVSREWEKIGKYNKI